MKASERYYQLHIEELRLKKRNEYNNRPDVIAKREEREKKKAEKEAEKLAKKEAKKEAEKEAKRLEKEAKRLEKERLTQEKVALAEATKRKLGPRSKKNIPSTSSGSLPDEEKI